MMDAKRYLRSVLDTDLAQDVLPVATTSQSFLDDSPMLECDPSV